jgi:hypothetical protein
VLLLLALALTVPPVLDTLDALETVVVLWDSKMECSVSSRLLALPLRPLTPLVVLSNDGTT